VHHEAQDSTRHLSRKGNEQTAPAAQRENRSEADRNCSSGTRTVFEEAILHTDEVGTIVKRDGKSPPLDDHDE
jgi:hypothetical protein